jgi:putative peptidoglycan lipid II flippase
MALAWGVLLAGFLQLLFQIPFLASIGMIPIPRFKPRDEGVKKVAKLMVPALFGVSVSQINLLLDTILASFLITGSVSWLYYSDRLVELPLGVIGIAIATVILPSLSRIHSRKQSDHFSSTLDWALRLIVLIGIPAATALVVLANPLITTLFQYGEMTGGDVEKISGSLRAYSLGLLAFMLIKVLAPGYFSRQDTKTPVKIGIKAMVANMIFNLALIIPFAHVGLALATSLSAWLNAYWLYSGLRKEEVYKPETGWFSILIRIALATVAMASVLWFGSDQMGEWQTWSWFGRSWRLAILCGAGLGTYLVVLVATGVRPNQFAQQTK